MSYYARYSCTDCGYLILQCRCEKGGNTMPKKEWKEEESQSDIWLPTEEGEEMIGKVIDSMPGEYGTQWVIETAEGTFRTASHKVLQNRMAKIKTGDEVKIIYDGEEPPAVKGRNPTKMYRVFKAS